MTFSVPAPVLDPIIRAALVEDMGRMGDVTSNACIPAQTRFSGAIVARQAGVLAGIDCARQTFHLLDPAIGFHAQVQDGEPLEAGRIIATLNGPARAILSGERVALNFLGHLSGIASLTRNYADAIAGTGARIAATRKTTPNLRCLEKYAVQCGGGWPHRFGLDDAMLIKDNHIAACGGITAALTRAKAHAGHMMVVEVEVDSLDQLAEALPHAPHAILLDNFSVNDLKKAVAVAKAFSAKVDAGFASENATSNTKAILEASGGVTLTTVRAIAETGVDVISVGALTHSAPCFDLGLDSL